MHPARLNQDVIDTFARLRGPFKRSNNLPVVLRLVLQGAKVDVVVA